MSQRLSQRYPRLGYDAAYAGEKKCAHCNDIATHRIDVQCDYMRGNDDVFLVCDRGLSLAQDGKWAVLYGAIENTKAVRKIAS